MITKKYIKVFLLMYGCLFFTVALAQKKLNFTKEISGRIDNDVYLDPFGLNKDSYYSNGFFLQYAQVKPTSSVKQIQRYNFAQMLYMPGNVQDVFYKRKKEDRPYAGYLYVGYANDYYKPQKVFGWEIQAGVMGSWSLAEQVQHMIHDIIKSKFFPLWNKQVQNAVGIHIKGNLAKSYSFNENHTVSFRLVPTTQATIGNFFCNLNVGSYVCIGKMEKLENSLLFNAGINNNNYTAKTKPEFFLYTYPNVQIQVHNAALQGAMFSKQPSNVPVTQPQLLVFSQTTGLGIAYKRIAAKMEYVYLTKEATTQQRDHRWAGIQLNYRIK